MIQQYDQRNDNIKIWIDGILYKREDAKISVFDSLSQGGDAVWEGLRVYNGKVFCLDEHLNRMLESAKSMAFEKVPKLTYIKEAIFSTLKANKMFNDKASNGYQYVRVNIILGKILLGNIGQ